MKIIGSIIDAGDSSRYKGNYAMIFRNIDGGYFPSLIPMKDAIICDIGQFSDVHDLTILNTSEKIIKPAIKALNSSNQDIRTLDKLIQGELNKKILTLESIRIDTYAFAAKYSDFFYMIR